MIPFPRSVDNQRWRISVVACRQGEEWLGKGTGFILYDGESHVVLTSAHVVQGVWERFGTEVQFGVMPFGQRMISVKEVLRIDEESDLAVLRPADIGATRDTHSFGEPFVGSTVYSIGYKEEDSYENLVTSVGLITHVGLFAHKENQLYSFQQLAGQVPKPKRLKGATLMSSFHGKRH